ncbi:GNAT family N-acetyltransferase [Xanthobacter flavus]|uniref:GNAT family N-acetyltransferase n=1 Tax=Xanthobacter flavus TaxID=281 RepID=UPI00372780BD
MKMVVGRVVGSIAEIEEADWDACLPGEAECHAYFSACDGAAAASGVGLRCGAVVVTDSVGVVAVAPVFLFTYRLDTPLQGRARRWAEAAFRLVPGLAALRVLCVGSPYAERCHLGFAARLDAAARAEAMQVLLTALEDEARARAAHLVAFKDLAPREDAELAPMLRCAGFASLGSLPVATLDLPFADAEGYLASLSGATRKDIRRKLAKAGAVRIEHRVGVVGLEGQIEALYEATRDRSGLDYGELEVLPPGYFAAVAEALGERAVFVLYFVGDTLAAFNLLLVEPDRVIDKFLGMRYPLARNHNVYAVSWMANVRFCLERAIGELQTGQTAYASKLRFGSRLVPSTIRFRHRNHLMQWLLARLAPRFSFDHLDPQLASSRTFPFPDG